MDVAVSEVGVCRKKISINFSAEDAEKEYSAALKDVQKRARVPGFRIGKAPVAIIEKNYGKDITEDLQDRLTSRGFDAAVKDNNLKVEKIVAVDKCPYKKGEPVSFTVTIEVPPTFELPAYKEIELPEFKETVTDEMLDKAVKEFQGLYAEYAKVTDRPVEHGDYVIIDFEGTCDGKPIEEIAPEAKQVAGGKKFYLPIEEQDYLPGLDKALIGTNVGDKKEVVVEFGETYGIKALAGKKAVYVVEVKEIGSKKLPPIAELATKVGLDETKLREAMRNREEQRLRDSKRELHESAVVAHLLKNCNFDLPEQVLMDEVHGRVFDVVQELKKHGYTEEKIKEKNQEIMERALIDAREVLKFDYIVGRIAEAENINVAEMDVTKQIVFMARREGIAPEKLVERLKKNGQLGSLYGYIRKRKTIDFLIANAKGAGVEPQEAAKPEEAPAT